MTLGGMRHLFLLTNLLAVMGGVAALVLARYARSERFEQPLRAVSLVLLIGTLDFFDYVIATYLFAILRIESVPAAAVSRIVGIVLTGALIYAIPHAYASLVRVRLDPILRGALGAIAMLVTVSFLAAFAAGVADSGLTVFRFVQLFSELVVVFAGARFVIVHRSGIEAPRLRRVVTTTVAAQLVLVPAIVVLNVMSVGRFDFRSMMPFTVNVLSLAYSLFYLSWVVLVFRYATIAVAVNRSIEATLHDLFDEYALSSREREIVRELIAGKSNQEIARTLFISPRTVDTHITNIYRKCGVRSRFELLALLNALRE
jgi:DNA-binding CsgD family transcriptional regulator